MLLQIEIIWML